MPGDRLIPFWKRSGGMWDGHPLIVWKNQVKPTTIKDLIASIPQANSSTIIVHESQGDSIPGSKEGGHGEAVGEGEQP